MEKPSKAAIPPPAPAKVPSREQQGDTEWPVWSAGLMLVSVCGVQLPEKCPSVGSRRRLVWALHSQTVCLSYPSGHHRGLPGARLSACSGHPNLLPSAQGAVGPVSGSRALPRFLFLN